MFKNMKFRQIKSDHQWKIFEYFLYLGGGWLLIINLIYFIF